MKRKRNEQQFQLYQFNISEYMDENHWSVILDEIFEHLDFSSITWKNGLSAISKEPFDGKLLAMLWLAGYFRKVYSCRGLETQCKDDIGFIYLRRNASCPSKTTLNDFRKSNLEALSSLLAQTVLIAGEMGLLSGHVYIDGTKVKANASKKKRLDKKKLEKNYEKIKEKCKDYFTSIEESVDEEEKEQLGNKYKNAVERKKKIEEKLSLLQSLDKERHNLTDPDSKLVMDNEDCYDGYNGQVASDNQIIVHADISEHENDFYDLEPMVEGTFNTDGYTMKSATTDAGYENSEHISHLTDKNFDVLVHPVRSNISKNTKYFNQNDFKYIYDKDIFICPAGKELHFEKDRISKKSNGKLAPKRVYFAQKEDCKHCPLKDKCLGGNRTRKDLPVRSDFQILYKNNQKACTEDGKQRLKERKYKVETVFGQIKGHVGLIGFNLRGKLKVLAEWRLICIGNNLRKIVDCMLNNRLEKGKRAFLSIVLQFFYIFRIFSGKNHNFIEYQCSF